MGALTSTRLDPDRTPSRLRLTQVGPLGLAEVASERPGGVDLGVGPDRIILALARQASGLRSFGRLVDLAPDDWTLLRGGVLGLDAASSLRLVVLPFSCGGRPFHVSPGAVLRGFSSGKPINRIVGRLFAALFEEAGALGPDEGHDLAEVALQVLQKAAWDDGGLSQRAALRARILDVIEARIRDPRLNADQIAAVLRCNPRNIHRAFEGEGCSVGQYIQQQRLDRCRAEIMRARPGQGSVTEIAFAWGFNNAAHFSRVFRKRFECAPSACRVGGRPQSGADRLGRAP